MSSSSVLMELFDSSHWPRRPPHPATGEVQYNVESLSNSHPVCWGWRILDESDIQWWIQNQYWPRQWCWNFLFVIQIQHKDDYQKKISKFRKSFMICGCISFKGPAQMAIITSTIDEQVYFKSWIIFWFHL